MPAIAEVKGTVDVGILALTAEDFEAVSDRLPDPGGIARGTREFVIRHAGEGRLTALVRGWSGDRVDPARAAAALIEEIAPSWIVVVGLGSAVPAEEPSLGDVLVATSVLDHGAHAVLGDGTHAFASAPLHPDAVALAAQLATSDLGAWSTTAAIGREAPAIDLSLRSFYGTKKTKADVLAILRRRAESAPRPPRLFTGAVLASDGRLDEADLLDAFLRAPRRFRAVETETAGVYGVAFARGVPVIAVRGIADVIGARRQSAWAEHARHAAASFATALVRSGLLARRAPSAATADPPKSQRPTDALTEAARLARLGDAALDRGDLDEAAQRYAEALPLFRAIGDVRGEANGALRFGEIALRRGDADEAQRRYQEALPLFRRVQDALGEANCVARLGDLALRRGDAEEARHRYQDALPLYRRAADVLGEANCVLRLGDLAHKRSDLDEARARFEVALGLYAELPEPYSMGLTHRRLARLAPDERLRRRHLEAARELWVRAGRQDLVAKLDAELGRPALTFPLVAKLDVAPATLRFRPRLPAVPAR
ncbi:MAG: tetratricopeptide repeat protein [Minicystis sp.]